MSEYINKADILGLIRKMERSRYLKNDSIITDTVLATTECIKEFVLTMSSADVQPVTFCKNCQWLADIKDVDTGEMYHTCGVLGFDVPNGFACNQGKRKGADE